jgi:DNA-directed RNA polymerase specialized sigma24 family protein
MNDPKAIENELYIEDSSRCETGFITEDDTQEAFVRIFSSNSNKYNDTRFRNGVEKNVQKERLNAEKSENKQLKHLFKLCRPSFGKVDFTDSYKTQMRLETLIIAILDLPLKSRQAIALVCIGGLKAKEAAALIGCDFKVFRNRLSYSRRLIRKKMQKSFTM